MYGHTPSPLFQARYDPKTYPTAALTALRDSDRIFTSDTWGGYLIYRRYPAKVFIDGRSDFYGPDFEAECADIVAVRYNWETTLAAHDVDTVLLAVDSPLSSALKSSRNWRAVYDDGIAIVFRVTGVNRLATQQPADNAAPSITRRMRAKAMKMGAEKNFGHSQLTAVTDVETESHIWRAINIHTLRMVSYRKGNNHQTTLTRMVGDGLLLASS
jgi:hypothetical protein